MCPPEHPHVPGSWVIAMLGYQVAFKVGPAVPATVLLIVVLVEILVAGLAGILVKCSILG